MLRRAPRLLLALALASCSSRLPRDFEIRYECKGVGEGISQLYRFTLRHDGSLEYEGRQGVKLLGVHHASIPPARVASIREALDGLDYFSLRENYHQGSDGCEQVLTVTCAGRTKSISFDDMASFVIEIEQELRGKDGMQYPPPTGQQLEHLRLERFSDSLAELVDLRRWIGTEEEKQSNRWWLDRDRAAGR